MSIKTILPEKGVVAIVGLQWGDEGKGKIVDLFAQWADVVARGTGGANAGHTIVVNGVSHVFHLVPSAILRDTEGVINVIGQGVAFDPAIMLDELAELDRLGVPYENLRISRNAHLVLPQHIVLDRIRESKSGDAKIGTTGKGIGPTYCDHVGRLGLRVVDLLNPDEFRRKLGRNLESKRAELTANPNLVMGMVEADQRLAPFFNPNGSISVDAVCTAYYEYGQQLRLHIADTESSVRQAVVDGKRVLLEGAQASLLSIDHGIYPNVTSSDSTIAGLANGVGLLGSQVDKVYGIVKAPAMTRVGAGVFPTELGPAEDSMFPDADINSQNPSEQCVAIRRVGKEFGSTTGRPRRIGWLDLPLLRHALRSGGDELILTKVDMMDECAEIRICTHYIYRGPEYDLGDRVLKPGDEVLVAFGDDALMQFMEAVYVTFPGWQTNLQSLESANQLPRMLMRIISLIEDAVERRVAIVSVGPDRDQTIVL